MATVKERLSGHKLKQVWLILELRKRGMVVQPPELSQVLNGVNTTPKAHKILEMCNGILDEYEGKCDE